MEAGWRREQVAYVDMVKGGLKVGKSDSTVAERVRKGKEFRSFKA